MGVTREKAKTSGEQGAGDLGTPAGRSHLKVSQSEQPQLCKFRIGAVWAELPTPI